MAEGRQGELLKDRCGQRRQVRTRVDQEFDLNPARLPLGREPE